MVRICLFIHFAFLWYLVGPLLNYTAMFSWSQMGWVNLYFVFVVLHLTYLHDFLNYNMIINDSIIGNNYRCNKYKLRNNNRMMFCFFITFLCVDSEKFVQDLFLLKYQIVFREWIYSRQIYAQKSRNNVCTLMPVYKNIFYRLALVRYIKFHYQVLFKFGPTNPFSKHTEDVMVPTLSPVEINFVSWQAYLNGLYLSGEIIILPSRFLKKISAILMPVNFQEWKWNLNFGEQGICSLV